MAHEQHDETPASPFSSTGFQVSALFLLVLVVAGIAIAIFHGGNGTAKGNHKQVIVTANSATGTSTTSSTGPCSLPAGSQQVPSETPPIGVTWEQVGAMSAPQSTTLGPQHVENGINVCFADNPAGALLAALDIWAEATGSVNTQVLWKQRAIDVPQGISNEAGALDSHGSFQIAGYKYVSYSPASAQLVVVLESPKETLLAIQMPMRWVDDDWRFVYPTSGGPVMEQLPSTTLSAPYVQWSEF